MRATTAMAVSLCALLVGACKEDDPGFIPEDAGHTGHSEIQACPDGIPETSVGLTIQGSEGNLRGKLVRASNLPAIKGHNSWTLQFTDVEDEPLEDVTLELDRAFGVMPAHGHHTNHDPVVEDLGDGEFSIEQINLHMDGMWELTFAPSSASAGSDTIMFPLCTDASIEAASSEH